MPARKLSRLSVADGPFSYDPLYSPTCLLLFHGICRGVAAAFVIAVCFPRLQPYARRAIFVATMMPFRLWSMSDSLLFKSHDSRLPSSLHSMPYVQSQAFARSHARQADRRI